MKKDPKIFLKHIIESIEEIEEFIKGISKKEFLRDFRTQSAVIRKIEIIGEAVKNLSPDFRNLYPKVSWRKAAGMRDTLIHEYFNVDLDIVWDTVGEDLPELKKEILEILEKLEGGGGE